MIQHLKQHRGILASVLLAALVVGLLAAGLVTWTLRLPHPRRAGRSQLARWLVLRDVASEPDDIRRSLIERLQAELERDEPFEAGAVTLKERSRARLERNCRQLQHDWFLLRAEQYSRLPPTERRDFLDRQLAALLTWCDLQRQFVPPRGSASASESGDTASWFFDQLETWIESADSQQRPVLEQAVTDGLVCWLATGDLQQHSASFRETLAERIARELDEGATGQGILGELPEDRRARFEANCHLLMASWFAARAADYQQVDSRQRQAFVDRQIDRLAAWNLGQWLAESSDSAASAPAAVWANLAQQADEWIEQAEPERRRSMRRLAAHMQRRALWRRLQQLLPAPSR